jgi:beta-lactamase class A
VFRTLALIVPAAAVLVVAAPTVENRSSSSSRPATEPIPRSGPASLWQLGPLIAQDTRVGVVVADARRGVLFRQNASAPHILASVAKVYILAAFLDYLAQEERDPNALELDQMELMIEQSDNVSAQDLWEVIGEEDGLADFLQRHRLPPVEPAEDGSWGSMRASALDVSHVLTRLYNGTLLDREKTRLALDLLSNVTDEQAWGVGTARQGSPATYLKNGWYPESDGWVVNSVGIISGQRGDYVLVLLTDSQPSMEYGIRVIENAVLFVRAHLP